MKNYIIFLTLFFVGASVKGSVQISVSQDRPAYIYTKSYSMTDSGSYYEYATDLSKSNYHIISLTFNGSINWTYTNNDSICWNAVENVEGAYMCDQVQYVSHTVDWDTDSFVYQTNSMGILTELVHVVVGINTNIWEMEVPAFSEHADLNAQAYYPNNSDPGYIQTQERRIAQTISKLKTGGKSNSKLRNLFSISASATQLLTPTDQYYAAPGSGNYSYMWSYEYLGQDTGTNIPPQSINIGSYGTLNTNGVLYKILPDNTEVDVTPFVAGDDYYNFNLGQPQKYHSYFSVFVNQPYPGPTFYTLETAGHAFWQLKTEAPLDALQYLDASLTNYLSHKWGFYPHGAICGLPGQLGNDDAHGFNMERVFYIGFPDLISGLQFTSGLSNSPPEYCIAINGFSCVGAAIATASDVGIWLPDFAWTPQNFGVELYLKYPGTNIDVTPRYSKY